VTGSSLDQDVEYPDRLFMLYFGFSWQIVRYYLTFVQERMPIYYSLTIVLFNAVLSELLTAL